MVGEGVAQHVASPRIRLAAQIKAEFHIGADHCGGFGFDPSEKTGPWFRKESSLGHPGGFGLSSAFLLGLLRRKLTWRGTHGLLRSHGSGLRLGLLRCRRRCDLWLLGPDRALRLFGATRSQNELQPGIHPGAVFFSGL